MRIVFLLPSRGSGGAERVMTKLANSMSNRHCVTLVTWDPPGAIPVYRVAESVRALQLDLLGGRGLGRWWRIVLRLRSLRSVVREVRPEVVLSFMDTANLTSILACAGLGVAAVVSERTDPAQHRVGLILRIARRVLYRQASRVVVPTDRVANFFRHARYRNLSVVPNPIDTARVFANAAAPGPSGRFRIVGMGRLGFEKGFDILIDAFSSIASLYPLWDLVLFGEGQERERLRSRARALGLEERVFLPGSTTTPELELASSNILAFPSLYEGFPNALGEGIAAGLPAIGFEGVSGVEELIIDDSTGVLVRPRGDRTALASALDRLMGDQALRARMGTAARVHSYCWNSGRVLAAWENLLGDVAAGTDSPCIGSNNSNLRTPVSSKPNQPLN